MDILLAESIVVQAIARFARGEPGAWIGLTAVIALIVFSAYRTWVRNVQDD